jgi:peptidoglycan DL-endopeptidase CwlO
VASNTATTHRAPKKLVTPTRTAVTLATATVGSIALVPGIAAAAPQLTVPQMKAEVDQLNGQAEAADEAFLVANSQLTALQNKVDQLTGRIELEQQSLGNAQAALGNLAAAQYKAGGVNDALSLMLKTSPDGYLQQASALAEITTKSASSVQDAQDVEHQLAQDKATAADDLSALQKTSDVMAAQKKIMDDKQAAAQALLNSMTASQQVQYKQLVQSSQPNISKAAISALPPAVSPRAQLAVNFAKAQIGRPYVYGASGPSAFDCSGLTMAAWAQAGVKMAHSSSEQFYEFPRVTAAELQPGDLVIYYPPSLHHVAIYVGNGMIIQAESSGTNVMYSPIGMMPIAGYVRP